MNENAYPGKTMKPYSSALLFCLITFASTAVADERYNHFPSLEASDLKTALCNLKSYNGKLSAITSKDKLSAVDMVKVHELTYTLENALQKMQSDLALMAVDLEEVHLASEKLDQDALKQYQEKYFAKSNLLTSPVNCKS